jgi:16S rRNA (guanine966-N2)-methyltransferase
MRIVGGKLRGQKLVSFEADNIRPTSDRVKETIFNVLMGQFEGARVLDLFSGTGNLAAESVSRGAISVDAVESHKRSLKIMKENFQKLKIESSIRVHPIDVFKFIRDYQGDAYDIILIDPPFTEKIGSLVMQALAQNQRLFGPATEIVLERSDHEPMNEAYEPLFCYKQKPFGDKTVHFFTQK